MGEGKFTTVFVGLATGTSGLSSQARLEGGGTFLSGSEDGGSKRRVRASGR